MRSYSRYVFLRSMSLLAKMTNMKGPSKLRSELSLAIASTATYQTCLMMPTTAVAVVGGVLRPVIVAGSIYRCARILNMFYFGVAFSKSD